MLHLWNNFPARQVNHFILLPPRFLHAFLGWNYPRCLILVAHIRNFFGGKSRYVEATREFNKILLYILKYKQYHQKSPQYDQILKKNEQMYALLVICLSLCPQNKLIDENVSTQLKEKYNDKMTKMQRYDDEAYAAYDELFSYACPKFITPSPPILDQPLTNYNQVILLHLMLLSVCLISIFCFV